MKNRKFIITEEQLKQLVEVLGVPDNLTNTTNQIYKYILDNLYKTKDKYISNETEYLIRGDFHINDFNITELKIFINILYSDKYNKATYNGGYEYTETTITDELRIKSLEYSPETSYIVIEIAIPIRREGYVKYSSIYNFFKKYKIDIIKALSHELKHKYDRYKKPEISLNDRLEYDNDIEGIDIKPLNRLVYAMYHMHDFENLVRNSELYTVLQFKKIRKPEFLNYLQKDETYQFLKKVEKIKINHIKEELIKGYLPKIKTTLNNNGIVTENKNNDYLINAIFKIIYDRININKISKLNGMIYKTNNDNVNKQLNIKKDKFSGSLLNNDILIDGYVEINDTSHMNYFYKKEKEINNKASVVIKKIDKLYSLLKEGIVLDDDSFVIKINNKLFE